MDMKETASYAVTKSRETHRGPQAPGRNKQPERASKPQDANVRAVQQQALRGPINRHR